MGPWEIHYLGKYLYGEYLYGELLFFQFSHQHIQVKQSPDVVASGFRFVCFVCVSLVPGYPLVIQHNYGKAPLWYALWHNQRVSPAGFTRGSNTSSARRRECATTSIPLKERNWCTGPKPPDFSARKGHDRYGEKGGELRCVKLCEVISQWVLWIARFVSVKLLVQFVQFV